MANWAVHTASSPLYTHLAGVIAGSEELLRVINRVEHTPPPNVLLAGVQYLLIRRPGHPLAEFYPSLTERPRPVEDIDPVFSRFLLEHEGELVAIGRERHTQTNEARRCVALLPAIWAGARDAFHLVDIGTSAGLNLALDRYHYRWGDYLEWGPESTVSLDAGLRGSAPVPRSIQVLSRVGLDLYPMDPDDPEDRDWLEALVWPEAKERRTRLREALRVTQGLPIELVAGDAVETLASVLDRLPAGAPAVVMNSFTFNQLTTEEREEIEEIVREARLERPLHRVWLELIGMDGEGAELRIDSGDGWETIGRAHHHGEWLELQ